MTKRFQGNRRKGAELMEFTLALLPMLVMIFTLLDASWAIFVKCSLSYAVRQGVRRGITITGTQATAAGSDLTSMIKLTVQQSALGLLAGDSGLAKIKVNYIQPPAYDSNAASVDVSGQSYGNSPGNILQVSIQGFSLSPLMPRIFGWGTAADKASTAISVVAADLIEPSRDVPTIGAAP